MVALSQSDAVHLLRRTEYVARPARVAFLTGMERAAAVADILSVSATPVPIPPEIDFNDEDNNWDQFVFASKWWIERMVRGAARPIQEKMAFFWHGHFCSEWGKVFDCKAMMDQNALFRNQGLGNFRSLAQAMAVQPAMLRYLDNAENRKSSPNQNFGRELLELFILGVGNYTEADVEASAAAWTGHNLDWDTGLYEFNAAEHDSGNKTFFGVTKNWNGPDIIDEVLFHNAAKKLIGAKFITRKLWEYFAYQKPAQNIVDEIAAVAVANDLAIKPWLTALLTRDEFYSATARQGLVRTPVDFVVAALYHTGLSTSETNPQWYLEDMGQAPFWPPNVSGWKVNGYWINASAMSARASFARHLTWTLLDGRSNSTSLTLASGSWTYPALDAMTPAQLVDTIAGAMGVTLSTTTRGALITWATGEATPWGQDWWRTTNIVTMGMLVPEMHVA